MECLDDNAVSVYVAGKLAPEERARVEDHLATCDLCLTITSAAARSERATEAPSPRMIGRYRIIEMLGQGGMGSVFVAHDPQLDRRVALKLVRSERIAQPMMQERLAREARAMAKVHHPNVVTVYDVGELDESVFIAMELIDGETLSRWLARKPEWREVVRVFVAAGRGLAAAHAGGIVHRDFKPDNVLIEKDGRVVVTDFGVAAMAEDIGKAATQPMVARGEPLGSATIVTTRTGTLLGTPRYMSPEQFRGEQVDPRTDQFSFAVALYEALYGQPPFEGTTIGELSEAVTAGRLRSPPRGHGAIDRILARALSADRGARFESMTALLDPLERAARPRGRGLWIGAGVLGIAAAAIGITVLVRPGAKSAPALHGARTQVLIAPFANHTGEPALDDTLDLVLGTVLQSSTHVDSTAGAAMADLAGRFDLPPTDVDAIAVKRAATDPRPIAAVHGVIEHGASGYTVTIDVPERFHGERTAATADALVPAVAGLTAELLEALGDPAAIDQRVPSTSLAALHAWSRGQMASLAGDQKAAAAEFERAVTLDPELAAARAALGLTLYNMERRPEASAQLERAFRSADRIPERQRLTLLGDYYGTIGRYSEAILAYQQLLAKWPGDARTEINLTATAIDANSWPLALEVARAAAVDHGDLEVVRRNLVLAELGNERLDDAMRDGAALATQIAHPSGYALAGLAAAYTLLGRHTEAHATVAAIAPIEADLGADAAADLAAYEGRLDDAVTSLGARTGSVEELLRARIALRRGDRAAAAAAARLAMSDDSMPSAYLAASMAVAAGDLEGAADKVRTWGERPETDRRLYGQLLAGDIAAAGQRWTDAITAYRAAERIGESWLLHARLGHALAGAGQYADAERELHWCLDHRGQAAIVANPSLSLLPEIYLALARSMDARHAGVAEVRAAYRAAASLASGAQNDPWTEEAVAAALR